MRMHDSKIRNYDLILKNIFTQCTILSKYADFMNSYGGVKVNCF